MQFAGGTACATTGNSFACIGGACFSLPTPACGRISSHLLTVAARIGASRPSTLMSRNRSNMRPERWSDQANRTPRPGHAEPRPGYPNGTACMKLRSALRLSQRTSPPQLPVRWTASRRESATSERQAGCDVPQGRSASFRMTIPPKRSQRSISRWPCSRSASRVWSVYGKTQSAAVSEELLRTVSATLPLGESNALQSPGAKGTGGAGAKKLIW